MESQVEFCLETCHVTRRDPGQALLGSQVEEDGQVGRPPIGGGCLERAQGFQRDPGAIALVGERGVGEPGTEDRSAGRQRGFDDFGHQLPPGGVEQEGVGQRIGRSGAVGAGKEDLPQALAEPRAAGLASDVDVETSARESASRGPRPASSCRLLRVPRS